MAEPIEIIIRKGSGGEGTGFGISGATPGGPSRTGTDFGTEEAKFLGQKTNADKAQAAAIAFGIATLKRQINYSISQYGNKTGNYIAQAEMELVMEGLNNALSIAGATALGFKSGGVAGAIIGAAISTSSIAIGYYNQYRTLQTNIAKLDTYANIMQERSGNTYNNDSRGTIY